VRPPDTACQNALFCADFEADALGSTPSGFQAAMQNGSVVVDQGQYYSGGHAAKLVTTAGSSTKTAFLKLTGSLFPLPNNVLYGRMMFRLESSPTESVHWTMIQAGGLIPGESYHALYRYGGQLPVTQGAAIGSQWMANYETPDSYSGTGPKTDCWWHANGHVVPIGRWTCVQWTFDGTNNQMHLALDGVPQTDLDVNGSGQGCVNQLPGYPWTAPLFDQLSVGWESYQPDESRTLYIDDLAVGSEPIGCPK
jgi:hypothetical protein